MTIKYSLVPLKSCTDDVIKAQGYGYLAYMEMLEKKSKTYDQIKCERCQRYHIWKRKLKPSNPRKLEKELEDE